MVKVAKLCDPFSDAIFKFIMPKSLRFVHEQVLADDLAASLHFTGLRSVDPSRCHGDLVTISSISQMDMQDFPLSAPPMTSCVGPRGLLHRAFFFPCSLRAA